jgi:hypothetical protein
VEVVELCAVRPQASTGESQQSLFGCFELQPCAAQRFLRVTLGEACLVLFELYAGFPQTAAHERV